MGKKEDEEQRMRGVNLCSYLYQLKAAEPGAQVASRKREGLVIQLCPTFCSPMDCSLPGSSVHGFSWQEYWSGLPYPPPGDLSDPGIEPTSPALAGRFFTAEAPRKPLREVK